MRHSILGLVTLSFVAVSPTLGQEEPSAAETSVSTEPTAKKACASECDCADTTITTTNQPSPTLTLETNASPSSQHGSSILANFLSELLQSTPKFRAEVAVHFSSDDCESNSIGIKVPVTISTVVGKNILQTGVPTTDKPMKFSTGFEKIVEEVIACGHRICSGNKCYDVKDEPVAGTDCSNPEQPKYESESGEEPVMVVPAAPPAPPPVFIAQSPVKQQQNEVQSIIEESGLEQITVPIPATTMLKLLVDRASMSTRLEMTQQLMSERQAAMEQIHALVYQNSRLESQIAVAEARQQAADQLAAAIVERAEQAVKLVSRSSEECGSESDDTSTARAMKAIQEDLSNIRRQIALLKKQPVPFAQSTIGTPVYQPYVPSAQKLTPPVSSENSQQRVYPAARKY